MEEFITINGKTAHIDWWNQYLLKRTVIDPITNCYLWQGSKKDTGHGIIMINRRRIGVHRVSAVLHLGLDPNNYELQANHKRECKNASCWNYDHLYLGTPADNVSDQVALNTLIGGMKPLLQCKRGHEMSEDNISYLTNGQRYCKLCRRLTRNARHARTGK